MDLFIDRDELGRGLARVQGIIEKRSTHPLLSHVLLHAVAGSQPVLRTTATDTEVAFLGEIAANVQRPGEIAVDAANLFQVVRSLPDSTARLRLGRGDRLEITSGRANFRLPGHPAAEYPPLPPFEQATQVFVRESDLRRVVEQTSFAVATDDARFGLNGAHVEVRSGTNGPRLRFVATDGHRLSAAELEFEGDPHVRFPPRSLIPRKALAVLRKLLEGPERLQLEFGTGALRLVQGSQSFWFRLLEGDFPDYGSLQQEGAHRVVLPREELLGSVRRVLLLVMDRSRAVRFSFADDLLTIDLRSAERGEVEESLPVDLQGPPITVGFNPRYLQDILQVIDSERVVLSMAHPLAPCWVRDPSRDDAFFVVMPMALD